MRRRWEAHGPNQSDEGGETEQMLAGEYNWRAGESHEYAFELELPPGPYPYHGTYFEMNWLVEAAVVLPWAVVPTDTAEFSLEPEGRESYVPGALTATEFHDQFPTRRTPDN
ncbi:MAG: hypothetical protein ABEN55_02190 [Bradymonadaceae bacterium]